jgi:hypothetical protein
MCRGSNRGADGRESDAEAASSGSDDSADGAQPGARHTRSAGGASPVAAPGEPAGSAGVQRDAAGRADNHDAHPGGGTCVADRVDGTGHSSGSGSEGGDSMVSEALGPNGVIEDIPVRWANRAPRMTGARRC